MNIIDYKLTEQDYIEVSKASGIEIALLKTVTEVESNGNGFVENKDGSIKPKILFEGHVLWSELKLLGLDPYPLSQKYPDLLYPKWTKQYYSKSNFGEHVRLNRAKLLINEECALKSASWGLFQILGNNHKACGYATVYDMVADFEKGERQQLDGFIKFITHEKLTPYLLGKDWRGFAKRYNGPGYEQNNYHIKLSEAYAKFSK